MTKHVHEHYIPTDAEVFAHMEDQQPLTLTGVEKAVTHAIRAKHLLFVTYAGSLRLVEPTAIGYGDQGQLLVRAYQRDGVTSPHGEWKLFRGDKIEGVWEITVAFEIQPSFRSGDVSMSVILAELSTTDVTTE